MKIISKGKIFLLLSFASLSLVSGGLSTWIIGNDTTTINGQITVGDVITNYTELIDAKSINSTGFKGVKYSWDGKIVAIYDDPLSISINFKINKDGLSKWNIEHPNKTFKVEIKSENNYSSTTNKPENEVSVFEWFNNTSYNFKINNFVIDGGTLTNNWNTNVPVFVSNSFTPTYTYTHSIDDAFMNAVNSGASNLVDCSFEMFFDINQNVRNKNGSKQNVDAYHKLISQTVFGIINNTKSFKYSGILAFGEN